MKGEIKYDLDDFRRDLFDQVEHNFGGELSLEKLIRCKDLFWLFCHMEANKLSLDEIEKSLSDSKVPADRKFLEMVYEVCKDDSEMLAAIYQSLFLKFYMVALKDSLVDEDKSIDRAIALLNLYVTKHLNL